MSTRSWMATLVFLMVIVGIGILYSRNVIHQPEEDFDVLAAHQDRTTGGSATPISSPADATVANLPIDVKPETAPEISREELRLQDQVDDESDELASLNRELQVLLRKKSEQQAQWEVEYPAQIKAVNAEIQKLTDEASRLSDEERDIEKNSELMIADRARRLELERSQVINQIREKEEAQRLTQDQIATLSVRIPDAVERDRQLVTLNERELALKRGLEDLRSQIADLENQTRLLKQNAQVEAVNREARIRSRQKEIQTEIADLRDRIQGLHREQDQVRLSIFATEDEIHQNHIDLQRHQMALQESQKQLEQAERKTGGSQVQ